MKLKRALARSDSGTAMVEFAIVVPILILLIVGIINFGYALGQKNAVNSAARQGARAAVVQNSPGGSAQAKAQTAVTAAAPPLATGATATVSPAPTNGAICGTTGSIGKNMKVTVTYPNENGWLADIPPFSSGAKPITSEAEFRCEY